MPPNIVIQLLRLIDSLTQFKNYPTAQFNFNKLEQMLKVSSQEGELLIELLFRFQKLFNITLKGKQLSKLQKNTNLYLILSANNHPSQEIHEIRLEAEQSQLLSDIIYYFQHVKIGSGFNIGHSGSELLQKVKRLYKAHPYFFEHRGNGLIYPTQLASSLGTKILSYHRGNKQLTELKINHCIIKIESRE